jgi:3',5'-cyclic AMP phosphodiesterase CpdA
MFRLAHLSDLHIAPLPRARPRDLMGKRLLGYLSWWQRRKRVHLREVLDALVRDLRAIRPDHVAITGDLVNIALPEEFRQAAVWLENLGGPDWITVVPGNHDVYVPISREESWDHWADYMRPDPPRNGGAVAPDRPGGAARRSANGLDADTADFPFLRERGPLALIGLSTAIATPLGWATGHLGETQLRALDALLGRLADGERCRVILLHHSPLEEISRRRKRLVDAQGLREVIARRGADLVLHGHEHISISGQIAGRDGALPVFGAACASRLHAHPERSAQYQVYGIERNIGGWRLEVETRSYDADRGAFRRASLRVPGQLESATTMKSLEENRDRRQL